MTRPYVGAFCAKWKEQVVRFAAQLHGVMGNLPSLTCNMLHCSEIGGGGGRFERMSFLRIPSSIKCSFGGGFEV
ncbi:hypothetical protein [Sphingobium fontiphilum]|uniref:hypothetical protein n=1 Tax=Sphingobium fontiphilum TaxID=944425 RepID=UPI00161A4F0F|nr:hypothetical protein [Sphingobium fontiphilum]